MNLLGRETSPYLLQHAGNPVEWRAWDEAALTRARSEDKPILLSIGYSACHWCHVMAHESFEDEETAALMNRLYVNIKVDREERPDLDRSYQLAHQLLTQRGGGWPLTVFLEPESLMPFFAGTYFPREPRYGMPSFREVLERVAEFYREHKQDLAGQVEEFRHFFRRLQTEMPVPAGTLDASPLHSAYEVLLKNFDPRDGGFGRAPKFPHSADIELLMQMAAEADGGDEKRRSARHMALLSLERMAQGGLFDHLAGGFCRYAVDNSWTIPHFEKMLYDNGALLTAYAQAWQLSGDAFYREVTEETGRWLIHEMQGPAGGFYSSLDADSEGEEGRYYTWNRDEIRSLLDESEFDAVSAWYGLGDPPNFEGRWHLRWTLERVRDAPSARPDVATAARLASARRKLLEARRRRVRPALDDKVLTAWNGIAIRGMAQAGQRLHNADFIRSAARAADFIHAQAWRSGRLMASWRDGRAAIPGYLDDHAFVLDGLLALLQVQWSDASLRWAQEIADALLAHFEDAERGGFWFTAHDRDPPLYRQKVFADDATPSGNAVAARALCTLGHLLGEPRYLDAAVRTVKAGFSAMRDYPEAHVTLLLSLQDMLQPPDFVVLRGAGPSITGWETELDAMPDFRRRVFRIPADTAALPGLLRQCTPHGEACAYVCSGTGCSLPIPAGRSLAGVLRQSG